MATFKYFWRNATQVSICVLLLINMILVFNYRSRVQTYFSSNAKLSVLVHYVQPASKDVGCHNTDISDTLTSLEQMNIPEDSIFFIESSCKQGLTARQACAVESAARINQDRNVFILFTGPQRKQLLQKGSVGLIQNELTNVHAARLNIYSITKQTPIERFMQLNKLNNSSYKIVHTSDVMRLVVLYKYGGIYLDLDTVTVKSFDSLPQNFLGRENHGNSTAIASGVLGFSKNGVGKRILERALIDISAHYFPRSWNYNGPLLIRRTILKVCNVTTIFDIKPDKCEGLNIFNHTYFFPLCWGAWSHYFQKKLFKPFEQHKEAYTFHVWNEVSKNAEIEKGSLYAALANTYCPTTHGSFNDEFGN